MERRPYRRKVQFYETDGMGIVYHGNYIHWMEEARTDFMEQLGCGYETLVDAGIDIALTDVSCHYRSMTRFGTAELTFCENCETDVMIPIKELIMSAYDLRKQREEQGNR